MSLPSVQRPLTAFVLGSLLGILGVGITYIKGSRAVRGWCLLGLLMRMVGLTGLGALAFLAWVQRRDAANPYEDACACTFEIPAGMSRVSDPEQPRRFELADPQAGLHLIDTTEPLGKVLVGSPLSYAAEIGSADDEAPFQAGVLAGYPAAVRAWVGRYQDEPIHRLELVFATEGRLHHLLVWSSAARSKENKAALLRLVESFRADPEDPAIAASTDEERFANFFTSAALYPDELRAELLTRKVALLATEEQRLHATRARVSDLLASGAASEKVQFAQREQSLREQQVAVVRARVEQGQKTWDLMQEVLGSKGHRP